MGGRKLLALDEGGAESGLRKAADDGEPGVSHRDHADLLRPEEQRQHEEGDVRCRLPTDLLDDGPRSRQ